MNEERMDKLTGLQAKAGMNIEETEQSMARIRQRAEGVERNITSLEEAFSEYERLYREVYPNDESELEKERVRLQEAIGILRQQIHTLTIELNAYDPIYKRAKEQYQEVKQMRNKDRQ